MDTGIDTKKLIQERYQELPQEVKDAVTASDLPTKMKNVASNHDLMIDQAGMLQNEILFVMLGMEPSSEFVNNMSRELGINREKANAVAKDVNDLIFAPIRKYLREWEEQEEQKNQEPDKSQQSMADLERVGGFTIEPTGQNGNGNGAAPANLPGAEAVTESKEDLLSGIEDPATIPPKSTTPEENHTDILVDHLLANPTGAAEEKIAKPAELPVESPIAKEAPKKAPSADSYREPI